MLMVHERRNGTHRSNAQIEVGKVLRRNRNRPSVVRSVGIGLRSGLRALVAISAADRCTTPDQVRSRLSTEKDPGSGSNAMIVFGVILVTLAAAVLLLGLARQLK